MSFELFKKQSTALGSISSEIKKPRKGETVFGKSTVESKEQFKKIKAQEQRKRLVMGTKKLAGQFGRGAFKAGKFVLPKLFKEVKSVWKQPKRRGRKKKMGWGY